MKIFVINMDKSVDRLLHMSQMLKRMEMRFERIRGVRGSEMSALERRCDFDSARSLLANRGIMTEGEIGCALSHLAVYDRMIKEELPCALVLEDDVELSPHFMEALNYASTRLDVSQPQIVLFSRNRFPKDPIAWDADGDVDFSFTPFKSMTCADAYVITRPAAELIRRVNYPVIVCSDNFRRWRRHFGLKLFRVLPATAYAMGAVFETEIPGRGQEVKGLTRLWYTVKDLYYIWRRGK